MNMGKLGALKPSADAEMQDESQATKAPALKLGGGGKPKMGFKMDLRKAQ